MTTAYLRKTLSGFCLDDSEDESCKAISLGEVIKVEWSRPRNARFHKYFFAMLKLIYKNTENFKSIQHLLAVIKIGIGHADLTVLKDGTEYWYPRSISWAAMDDDDFRAFFNKSVDWIIQNVLPVGKSELESELFSMLGYDLSNLR